MGASNLDNIGKLSSLGGEGREQSVQSWQQSAVHLHGHSYVHGSWERVIGALAAINMIIWVHRILRAQLPT